MERGVKVNLKDIKINSRPLPVQALAGNTEISIAIRQAKIIQDHMSKNGLTRMNLMEMRKVWGELK
jgi:hypothetical protein